MPITKTEVFDINALDNLMRCSAVRDIDKKNLTKYRKRAKLSGNNRVVIEYDFPKNWSALQKGRLTPIPFAFSQCSFPSQIGAALAQKYYWDLDFVNSQPCLAIQLAKRHSLTTPSLETYATHRDEIFTELMDQTHMTRDEIKQEWIKVMFGGSSFLHPLLPAIKEELIRLAAILRETNSDIYQQCVRLKDKGNVLASCLSISLQNEERRCLVALDSFLTTQGRSLDVFKFDGGHVRKLEGETEVPASLLRACEDAIFKETGYALTLVVKPLTHTYEFTRKDEYISGDVLINDEYAAKEFLRLVGDRVRKVDGYLWVCSDGLWTNSSDALRDCIAEVSSDLVFRQETISGVRIFDYGGNEKNIPNMLKQIYIHAKPGSLPLQFAYTLVEPPQNDAGLVPFMELIDIVTNHKIELKEYVLSWLAHMVQKPFELPGVTLIVTGKKGYGKDTLFDFLGEFVIGENYYKNYTDTNQFFDHYDTGKVNKVLVKLEEAERLLCLKNASKLKAMITAKTQNPNPKNKQAYEVKNFCRFVLTTNSGNPVEFTDGERRFVLLGASGEKKGNVEYWQTLRDLLFTPESGKAVADYLHHRDISSFQTYLLPKNEFQDFVVNSEISVEERFISQWDGQEILPQDLFTLYRSFCRSQNYTGTENFKQWVQWLVPLKRNDLFSVVVKGHSKSSYYYKPGVDQIECHIED